MSSPIEFCAVCVFSWKLAKHTVGYNQYYMTDVIETVSVESTLCQLRKWIIRRRVRMKNISEKSSPKGFRDYKAASFQLLVQYCMNLRGMDAGPTTSPPPPSPCAATIPPARRRTIKYFGSRRPNMHAPSGGTIYYIAFQNGVSKKFI